MKGAAIGTNMISHRRERVLMSDLFPPGIATQLFGEEEELETHHVVDDDGILPIPPIPSLIDPTTGLNRLAREPAPLRRASRYSGLPVRR